MRGMSMSCIGMFSVHLKFSTVVSWNKIIFGLQKASVYFNSNNDRFDKKLYKSKML